LPGGFFLLHKVDFLIGNDRIETIEIIGVDKQAGKYTMQYYDNQSNSGSMTATYSNRVLIFS